MKTFLMFLCLLLPTSAIPASPNDAGQIADTLEALRQAVNRHDFAALDDRLAPDFRYQGYTGDLGRQIMSQVVSGFQQSIRSIDVDHVERTGDTITAAVTLRMDSETSERSIVLDRDYRIVEASIADIQLAGHAATNPPPRPDPGLPDRSVIPFRLADRIIVVQAEVSGVAGNYLLDSGAPSIILNARYFDDAAIRTRPLDHPNPLGAGGEMNDVRGATELTLAWGGIRMSGRRGLVADLSHLEKNLGIPVVGLIGQSELEPFLVQFDYPGQRVILTRLDETGTPVFDDRQAPPALTVPFELAGHIPVIPVQIGDRRLSLGLDSGAAGAMLFTPLRDSLRGQYEIIERSEMKGADTNTQMGDVVEVGRMAVGGIEYGRMQFRFNDIAGHTPPFDGLLGYEFLANRQTAINYRKRQLLVWPAGS